MRKEADEKWRLFIVHSDDGLNDGLHGLSQNLQAETSGAELSSDSFVEVCANKQEQVFTHLLMSRESVRTWFLAQTADLCRKPPSLTWWSECRTSDWTPATHTCLSFARSESVKATETARVAIV